MNSALQRATAFADRFGLQYPFLMAPMAGACPSELAAAVCNGGGMGALGAVLMAPTQIEEWVCRTRALCHGPLQANLWVPDPAPVRNPDHEAEVMRFIESLGAPVSATAADTVWPDFDAQFDALLEARFPIISSIMGVFSPAQVEALKRADVSWFACVTSVDEARQAASAGADVLVAQGAEAGGHRGAFQADGADARAVGLFALLPQVVDAVDIPVVATGGIGDARGWAAALQLGASAVQVGTGLLRCPEASLPGIWSQGLARASATDTRLTRAFSGRWGRALNNRYIEEAAICGVAPAPYPIQRGLTAGMRAMAVEKDDAGLMQAWCGQAASLASTESAESLPRHWWQVVIDDAV